MYSEIELEKTQEQQAIGKWLIETIAKSIGIEPDADRIDRAIYKGTDCGAWVRFDEEGIMVGTIVEGSDAEYSERIEITDDATELCKRFWDAVQNCENFSAEAWAEMDLDETGDC